MLESKMKKCVVRRTLGLCAHDFLLEILQKNEEDKKHVCVCARGLLESKMKKCVARRTLGQHVHDFFYMGVLKKHRSFVFVF